MYRGIQWASYEIVRAGSGDVQSKQRFRTEKFEVYGIHKNGKRVKLAVVLGEDRAKRLGIGATKPKLPKRKRDWYG